MVDGERSQRRGPRRSAASSWSGFYARARARGPRTSSACDRITVRAWERKQPCLPSPAHETGVPSGARTPRLRAPPIDVLFRMRASPEWRMPTRFRAGQFWPECNVCAAGGQSSGWAGMATRGGMHTPQMCLCSIDRIQCRVSPRSGSDGDGTLAPPYGTPCSSYGLAYTSVGDGVPSCPRRAHVGVIAAARSWQGGRLHSTYPSEP